MKNPDDYTECPTCGDWAEWNHTIGRFVCRRCQQARRALGLGLFTP